MLSAGWKKKAVSTVLWANQLLSGGEAISHESDRWALHEHASRFDRLASAARIEPFSSLLDHTDVRFDMGGDEHPEGMAATNELMARDGVSTSANEALAVLDGLLAVVTAARPRFGIVKNDYDAVVAELSESIEFAKKAGASAAEFNLSVVA